MKNEKNSNNKRVLIVSEKDSRKERGGDVVIAHKLNTYFLAKGFEVHLQNASVLRNAGQCVYFSFFETLKLPKSTWHFRLTTLDDWAKNYQFIFLVGPNWLANASICQKHTKIYFYPYDNFHLNLFLRAKHERGLRKWYSLCQAQLWRKLLERIKGNIVFVAKRDFRLTKSYSQANLLYVPNGVIELNQAIYKPNIEKVRTFGFFGTLQSLQSLRAIVFVGALLIKFNEHKKMEHPFVCQIFGANPSPKLLHIISKNPYLHYKGLFTETCEIGNQVDLCLFPLYDGTGAKNRVLEAMANNIPIIVSEEAVIEYQGFPKSLTVKSQRLEDWIEAITRLSLEKRKETFSLRQWEWEYLLDKYLWPSLNHLSK